MRQHEARRRADKVATLQARITARTACGEAAKRAKPAPALRPLQAWVKRHKLAPCVHVSLHEGRLMATLAPAAQAETAWREGCYVLETAVPQPTLEAQAVHDRDRDLHEVEQDVRTLTTGLLEGRPIFVRQAPRPRAHVLVTLLAVKVVRERRRALVAAFGTTEDAKRAVPVEEALLVRARLWLLTSHVQGTAVTRLPAPDARQAALRNALGTPLPTPRRVRKM
jgi:hypothetical protein